jgi:rSAM/selenodomain-associated transferase 1
MRLGNILTSRNQIDIIYQFQQIELKKAMAQPPNGGDERAVQTSNPVRNPSKKVIVFVRVPKPGRVKTRLAQRVGGDTALRLYRHFVEDIVQTVAGRGYSIVACHTPADGRAEMRAWLGPDHIYMPQHGASLGERMCSALADVFSEGIRRAVLIGSDFPDLGAGILDEAFQGLTSHDLTIGPAFDGGYYLIGFNAASFSPHIFQGIPWGTRHVFQCTADQVRKNNLSMHVLPTWRDIDTYEDLKAFFSKAGEKGLRELKTMRYLIRRQKTLGL